MLKIHIVLLPTAAVGIIAGTYAAAAAIAAGAAVSTDGAGFNFPECPDAYQKYSHR